MSHRTVRAFPHGFADGGLLLLRLSRWQLTARLHGPLDLVFGAFEGVLYQLATVAVVLLTMPRAQSLAGWGHPQLLLLAAFRLCVHTAYMPFFDNVMELPRLMRSQEFDRFLTRPRSPFLQLMTSRFQVNFLGDLVVAATVLWLALSALEVRWSGSGVLLGVVLLGCGVAAEASMQTVASSLALRTVGEQAPILIEEITALREPAELEGAIHDRLRDLDLAQGAVIMTASKDLSLPWLRAAAIITRHQGLQAHLSADAFDRVPTAAPLASLLMVLYAAVIHANHGPAELLDKRHRLARQIVAAHSLPDLPGSADLLRIHDHLDTMADRFRRNAALLDAPAGPFAYPSGLSPAAGYTAFPRLNRPRADFLAWVRECGAAGLRLSPTVVHGGTTGAWQALLPGQHLRVNLSESPQRTAAGLQHLGAALRRSTDPATAGVVPG
ncbi:ABC-2 family transporter protein [Kitasatospora sp. NPDC058263]